MKNILVAIDDIEATTRESAIIQRAIALAQAFSSKLWLLHIVPQAGITPFTVPRAALRDQAASELRHEHKTLQHLAARLRDSGIDATALLVGGSTVRTILQEADRLDADLIVVKSHRHGLLYRALLDGAGERLLNQSSRPVMFVPDLTDTVAAHAGEHNTDSRHSQLGE